jgi:hypothetical protein
MPKTESWAGGNRYGEGWQGGTRYGWVGRRQLWTDVLAKVTNGLVLSVAGATTTAPKDALLTGSLCVAGVGNNVHPRNVVITVTHGTSVIAETFLVTGTDISGKVVTELLTITATGTTKTATGLRAFKTVTKITEVASANASTNTIIGGSGDVLGLDDFLSVPGYALKEFFNAAVVTTGTFVIGSVAANADSFGTFLPATVPNGTNDYEVLFAVPDTD